MKLFLREHALLIVLHVVQFFAVLGIYWLDGYHRLAPALYSVFLGLFLLGSYLTYHYITRRRYFGLLSHPPATMEESVQRLDQTPVGEALEELLRLQYRSYHEQLAAIQREQKQHLTFMDQWVHQMKTPLSVIELTVQQVDEPEYASIREETERMRSGLNTILYMARLRTFQQDFHPKSVSLSQIMHEVIHEHKRSFIRNNVYPDVQDQDGVLMVESDEKWLFFMLSQLVMNAVKYSSGTGRKIHIHSFIRNRQAVLEVRDHGIGIPASDLKRVFDPFFTGENGRHFRESTGMGLYLTREAAEHLDHTLELESALGEGTTVRIIFQSWQQS
ncbi:sensor histidine kinase [Paenibacillus wulumuqiensis]|uniref:sensor histidine kinase n=1 Tax=Paenibacillus wulumuqiensis TaxID=1567107 RepID=UPI0006197757|nr:sensor histidine kinase [Paenibacillus wulumuqiensis]